MEFLAPKAGGIYCDATLGLGGHAQTLLGNDVTIGHLYGIDRDSEALACAQERLQPFADRVTFVHGRFSEIRELLHSQNAPLLDGCLLDLGVSSLQFDHPERGFSFRHSGPLDMRMDPTCGESAAELIARIDEDSLETILRNLGEERHAKRIARAMVEARTQQPLCTTFDLSALISKVVPNRERGKDPATRSFQALRIAVNDELGEIERFLQTIVPCLKPGARLVIISFHSLEDRIVKYGLRGLKASGELAILTKHVVVPTRAECSRNPRSRSAKLRAAERCAS
jgi:16S rRNA (cytosine1402-N4)-methyltransferase